VAVAALFASLAVGAASAATAQTSGSARSEAAVKHSRYQIGVMERVLEGAVEHGATITRERLQAVVPAQMLISENARVRGFRLEGYGVFFDVEVPSLLGALPWSFRTLDQNDLGLSSALKALERHINAMGDADLQQALKRVELHVDPVSAGQVVGPVIATAATGGPASVSAPPPQASTPRDPILNDPEEAYRAEIKQALMDAMLDYSAALGIAADEWLTVAARSNEERPRLAPADSDAHTVVMRCRGADLATFRAGQVSREEALKRIEIKDF
jgi:hypothetical protein